MTSQRNIISYNTELTDCLRAIIAYCMIAIAEHDLRLNMETYDVLRILTISLVDKTNIVDLFRQAREGNDYQNDTQLKLNFF